jgi:hypothetical protein
MKYRHKPAEVLAYEFEPAGTVAGMPDWLKVAIEAGTIFVYLEDGEALIERLAIETPEGPLSARPGDWIVCDAGDIFPVKAERFARAFEQSTEVPAKAPIAKKAKARA